MLDDLLTKGLLVVFCGTAAGLRSAALRQYYAGRGNQFWEVLSKVGLTPHKLSPDKYALLLEFGIGLTDIAKCQAGADSKIAFKSDDGALLRAKIAQFHPRVLCFNGKRAGKAYFRTATIDYGIQSETIGDAQIFVAPSTSGVARKHWDIAEWQRLADLVRTANPLA
jgi:TDG/mug DNA glycosylase family protein